MSFYGADSLEAIWQQQLGTAGLTGFERTKWKRSPQKLTDKMLAMSQERILDPRLIAKLLRMAFDDPTLGAMINLVKRTILKCGVIIRESTEMFRGPRKQQFYQFIDTEYRRFFGECLVNLFALGFCAFTWVPHDEFGGRPMCIDIQTMQVKVSRNCLGEVRFHYQPLGTNFFTDMGKRRVFSFDKSGDSIKRREPEILTYYVSAPSADGKIRSHMTALLEDVYLNELKRQCSIQSDLSRARPTVFVSRREEKQDDLKSLGESIVDNLAYKCPRNMNDLGSAPTGNLNLGDPVAGRSRSLATTMAHAISRGVPASAVKASLQSPGGFGHGSASEFVNVQRLGDGFQVEKTPHQAEGPDYLRYQSEYEERAAFLFGVPKMLWSNSNPSRKHKTLASGGEDSADKILASTIRFWSTALSQIGSKSYCAMFRDHHLMLRSLEREGAIKKRRRAKGAPDHNAAKKRKKKESHSKSEDDDLPALETDRDENEREQPKKKKHKTNAWPAAESLRALNNVLTKVQETPTYPEVEDPGEENEDETREDGYSSGDDEDGELFHFQASVQAEFSFPGVIDMRSVEMIYNRGLMKTSVFRGYVNREYGIPLEDIESEVIPVAPPPMPGVPLPGKAKPSGGEEKKEKKAGKQKEKQKEKEKEKKQEKPQQKPKQQQQTPKPEQQTKKPQQANKPSDTSAVAKKPKSKK